MQIKSGQAKKPSTPYNQINSKKANNNINPILIKILYKK